MDIKVLPNKIREAEEYARKHPFDLLQPGDKNFDKVWGEKIKKREDKMERVKKDAEAEYADRKEFEERKRRNPESKKYL